MKGIRTLLPLLILLVAAVAMAARVVDEDRKIYIVDRTGEYWEVSQSVELGFKPSKFQYGIGRNAFTPLDDSNLTSTIDNTDRRKRVIGVNIDGDAHAYAINRLRYHEIANTTIAGTPITAGY